MPLKRLTHERYDRMRQDGTFGPVTPTPMPPERPPIPDDLPPIKEAHPAWWHVLRVERDSEGYPRDTLIFETRDEVLALRVCDAQKYRCRVVKWGSRQRPYQNMKPIMQPEPVDPRRV